MEYLYWDLIAHRIAQGTGDAVWHSLRPPAPASFSPQAPSASLGALPEMSPSSKLITSYFLHTCCSLYLECLSFTLENSLFTSKIQLKCYLFHKVFSGSEPCPFQSSQSTAFKSLFFKYLFCGTWIFCLHICLLQKAVNVLKQALYFLHLCLLHI